MLPVCGQLVYFIREVEELTEAWKMQKAHFESNSLMNKIFHKKTHHSRIIMKKSTPTQPHLRSMGDIYIYISEED